ncbi:MAG: hypothetical protein IVW57_17275, partial [Ktedonobacterales bacterium]|nr:hypothetical protein [Ktedonobacterales bacterium]
MQNSIYRPSVGRALIVGTNRDPYYVNWSIYGPTGTLLLSSDLGQLKTGGVPVPSEDLTPVQTGKQQISAVHYDTATKRAWVRVYTPITAQLGQPGPVLGFLAATLRLDRIWGIVGSDQGANGNGSYAFIADESGIRIADPNASELFTAVLPLSASTQRLIASEQRFGPNVTPSAVDLPEVAQSLGTRAATDQDTFQGIAVPGSGARYEFVRLRMTSDAFAGQKLNPMLKLAGLPWSYFVLSPVSTITAVTNEQVKTSLISAGVIAILAILIGLLFGRGTTRPVRSSVMELEGAAAALKALASRQENSAGEQHWVVDACKTGLESVRYLSDAMNQAARRIIDASNWFSEYWDRLTEDQARRTVAHLQELAHYIDEAARRQQASSDRLDKAITVTMQVSDQLVAGATAATDSAEQLEQVVSDLQHVVGGKRRVSVSDMEAGERLDHLGQPELPPAAMPRQLPDPGARQPVGVRAQQRGAPSAWPGSADPSLSQGGWADYPAPPPGQYNGNGYNGNGYGYN